MIHIKDAEDRAALAERKAQDRVPRVEMENATTLASANEDAKGHVWKITLLEGELGGAPDSRGGRVEFPWLVQRGSRCRAVAGGVREGVWEQFVELTLLQTRGSKLCLSIVGPPWVRNHLSEGMQIAAPRLTEVAGELSTLRSVVTSVVEFALGRSPDETFRVEVVDELVPLVELLCQAVMGRVSTPEYLLSGTRGCVWPCPIIRSINCYRFLRFWCR
jgi:hypothetical protein